MDENEQGFTLIELLVVMIIIGILAAIAIPVFLNQRKNAVDASYKSDLRTIANELESYYTDNEVYPAGFSAVTAAGAVVPVGSTSVRVSKNTSVAIQFNATRTAYCVLASNAGGKGSHNWVYVSDQGGLQANTVTSCALAGTYATN
jgi:prepilin-type N-terminal cleavage/methylation domain-containing protein